MGHPADPHSVHQTRCPTETRPGGKGIRAGRVLDIDTGHDLMLCEPKAVAELLLRSTNA